MAAVDLTILDEARASPSGNGMYCAFIASDKSLASALGRGDVSTNKAAILDLPTAAAKGVPPPPANSARLRFARTNDGAKSIAHVPTICFLTVKFA